MTSSSEHLPFRSQHLFILSVGLWVLGALVLVVMSVFAHRQAVFPGDVGLAKAIQSIQAPPLVRFINVASDANWPYPAGVAVIAVVAVLAVALRFRAAICAAIAGFAADLVNVTLNGIVARPRPNNVQVRVIAHLGLHSFPSGHVTHVITFYGFLFYLSHRSWGRARTAASNAPVQDSGWVAAALPPQVWRRFLVGVQIVCAYFLVLIGPSRVLEGEHWPSDVVASYLLGALALMFVIALYHLLGAEWQQFSRRQAQDTGWAADHIGRVGVATVRRHRGNTEETQRRQARRCDDGATDSEGVPDRES